MVDPTNVYKEYYLSVMNVENEIESLASMEFIVITVGTGHLRQYNEFNMMQNKPNPFLGSTVFTISSPSNFSGTKAEIIIRDLTGRIVDQIPFELRSRKTELRFENVNGLKGAFTYSLFINKQLIQTRKMIMM